MIKKLIYLSALFIVSINTLAQDMYRVATGKLNVRATENPQSKIIGYIPNEQNVLVLDSSNSNYFKIKVTNAIGYADSKYLTKIYGIEQPHNVDQYNLMVVGMAVGILIFGSLCYFLFKTSSRKYALPILVLLISGTIIYFGYNHFFDRRNEAISLVQKSKYEYSNPLEAFAFGINAVNATNLDYANIIAQKDKSRRYFWEAEKKEDDIYLVSFMDAEKSGQHWEVDLKNKIVRLVNNDKFLTEKYLR